MNNDMVDHNEVEVVKDDHLYEPDILAEQEEKLCEKIKTHKLKSSAELQLEAKEEDLVLAAKLGKTLLEQNEELNSENYRHLRKLEVRFSLLKF